MGPFEFFHKHCGRSGPLFFLGLLLPCIALMALALVNAVNECLSSSSYFYILRTPLGLFGLLIALLMVRKAILLRGQHRRRDSDCRPLSQNELRAARSKLLRNRISRKL